MSEWEFVAADLSQAELRIAAHMSGDVSMISAYREGRDVHWDTVLFMIGAGHMAEYQKQAIETVTKLNVCQKYGKPSLSDALILMRELGVEACVKVWKGWKDARNARSEEHTSELQSRP